MNHQEVGSIIRVIERLWPTVPNRAPTDSETVRVWQIVLADVPMTGAELVVTNANRADEPFPPTPGAIAKRYHDAVDAATGERAPAADEAWLEVSRQVQRRGFYAGAPDGWSHPAVTAAADAIGWRELCHGETMVTRAHFIRLYPTILERTVAARSLARTLDVLGVPDLFRAVGPAAAHPPDSITTGVTNDATHTREPGL